jgi:hypothetical protein
MTPFHFSSRQRRLFGNYEPAQENLGNARAVVLCHPIGNEQIFAYRTMRLLAARRGRIYRDLSGRLKSAMGATPAQTDHDRKELEELHPSLPADQRRVARVIARKSSRRYSMCPSRTRRSSSIRRGSYVHIRMRARPAARVGIGLDKGFELVTEAAKNWRRLSGV